MIYTYNPLAAPRRATEAPLKTHILQEEGRTYCRQRVKPTHIQTENKPDANLCKSCLYAMNQLKREGMG